jgi:hypothetical protein
MIARGDPVEVRFVDRLQGETWKPATVSYVKADEIGAVFADHTRMSVKKPNWRAPC